MRTQRLQEEMMRFYYLLPFSLQIMRPYSFLQHIKSKINMRTRDKICEIRGYIAFLLPYSFASESLTYLLKTGRMVGVVSDDDVTT